MMIRILVVDDEPAIRAAYQEIIKPKIATTNQSLSEMRARLFGSRSNLATPSTSSRENFDLICCAGAVEGVEAVRQAQAQGQPFALAFLDMRMPPGPDGLWAATKIRALDNKIDLIIVTAYSDIDPEEISRQVPPAGSIFYLQKPFHPHEIKQLASALGRRRQAEDHIRRLAYFDGITGLPNRAFFKECCNQALETARRYQRILAILFLDLDNFKRINDTLGHAIGDRLLTEVTQRMITSLRTCDSIIQGRIDVENRDLARLGGDEFILLLTEISTARDAALVAGRLLEALASPFILAGHEVTVTASIGIAIYPTDTQDSETLIKYADMAMYTAKQKGRNQFQFYDQAMNVTALKRLTLENALRRALAHNEMSLYYQPQVDIATGKISGVEALVRWSSAELGEVSPVEFIPVAEETGLILPLGDWVLKTACTQCKIWRDAGIMVPRVAVNISVCQFAQDDFPNHVANILAEVGLDPSALELEITESLLMKEGESSLATLRELKKLGLQLAIDDFGTGYSSLNYLKRFPIDRLKIDRAFVCGVDHDPQDQAITIAVIAMADSMALKVTAEGVELSSQLQFLKEHKCCEMQGFYLSRPLPVADATRFLLSAQL